MVEEKSCKNTCILPRTWKGVRPTTAYQPSLFSLLVSDSFGG
jgi:hypothetical protein